MRAIHQATKRRAIGELVNHTSNEFDRYSISVFRGRFLLSNFIRNEGISTNTARNNLFVEKKLVSINRLYSQSCAYSAASAFNNEKYNNLTEENSLLSDEELHQKIVGIINKKQDPYNLLLESANDIRPKLETFKAVINYKCQAKHSQFSSSSAQEAYYLLQLLKEKLISKDNVMSSSQYFGNSLEMMDSLTNIHNLVLTAFIQSSFKHNNQYQVLRAQEIFDEMIDPISKESDILYIYRNQKSYEIMINAWTSTKMHQSFRNSLKLLKRMEYLYRKENQFEMKPKLSYYRNVLKCLANNMTKQSLEEAAQIIDEMDYNKKHYNFQLQPDTTCYNYLLQIYTQSSSHSLSDITILLRKMERQFTLQPDGNSYTYALEALAKLKNDLLVPLQAMKYLEVCCARYGNGNDKFTNIDLRKIFKYVLKTWYFNHYFNSGEKSKEVLQKFKALHQTLDSELIRLSIQCWNSPETSNTMYEHDNALSLLQEMQQQYLQGNISCKPTISAYNAYLEICSTLQLSSSHDAQKRQVMTNAVQMLTTLKVQPNKSTFKLLFKCCHVLLQEKEQIKSLQTVFRLCCQSRLLDEELFKLFQDFLGIPTFRHLIQKLKSQDHGDSEEVYHVSLPFEWSQKSNKRLCVSIDGSIFVWNELNKDYIMPNKIKQRLRKGGRHFVEEADIVSTTQILQF